ncbi:interferon-induced protein 44-like, partial [Gigantopelta aegis]|uniref:interferon-induced protein 44-like n=1 Tax=Gigantopelta aegis TaxID=1735272 RepID=UPI001B887F1C
YTTHYIEVYQVINNPVPEGPWRKIPDVSIQTLRTDLEKYCPVEGLEDQFVNILLIGQVGAGKSSFFNSVNSVFRDRVTSKARSGGAEHSLTTTFRMYKIKSKETGYPLKFRLCDTRGLEEGQGLDIVDLVSVLDGHITDGYE